MTTVKKFKGLGRKREKGRIYINGRATIGETDEDFICPTLDWWPPEKCDYRTCAWGHASLLNLVKFQSFCL